MAGVIKVKNFNKELYKSQKVNINNNKQITFAFEHLKLLCLEEIGGKEIGRSYQGKKKHILIVHLWGNFFKLEF